VSNFRSPRGRNARSVSRPLVESLEVRLCLSTTAHLQAFQTAMPPHHALTATVHQDGHPVGRPRHLHALVATHQISQGARQHLAWERHNLANLGRGSRFEPGPGPDQETVHNPNNRLTSNVLSAYGGIGSTGWTPPDDNIAVGSQDSGTGPSTVILAVNEQIALFDKSGNPYNNSSNLYSGNNLAITSTDPSKQSASLFHASNSAFDPRILFDPANGGHFILTAVEQSTRPQSSFLDIAVSMSANPRTAADWYTYRYSVTQTISKTATWMDFPSLGMDATTLYVTGNMFGFTNGSFRGVKLITFDKNAMEIGSKVSGPVNTKIFTDGSFSMQPAVTYGSNALAEYLIQTENGSNSTTVRLDAITNPLTAGALTDAQIYVTVPAYNTNLTKAPQLGSSNLINTNDARMLSAVFRNGSLWAADTIESTTGKTVARWYEINPVVSSPLTASGNIDPGGSVYTFFPSITADASGNVAISYAESSPTEHPSASFAAAPITTTTSFTPAASPNIQAGAASYGGSRWGDYSGIAADPSNSGIFYAVGEATQSDGNWGTWWTQATPPPTTAPATPNLTATAENSGPILLSWNAVAGAASYTVYGSTDSTFDPFATNPPSAPIVIPTASAQTSVENTNVQPNTKYYYYVVATNSSGSSPLPSSSSSAIAVTPTPVFSDSFPTSLAFPYSPWTTASTTSGAAAWSIPTSGGWVSQTSTAAADVKKAIDQQTVSTSDVIITAKVHIDSWHDGELARAGIGLFTDSSGKGYNLVLTGRFSNTGATNTIAAPHLGFLDDLVAWGSDLTLPSPGVITVGPGSPWYWFKMEDRNGVLYGSFWKDGDPEPATWMISQAGWSDHTTGGPALNGGSGGTFNGVTSNSTASFTSVTVTQ
jgi:hypothetical protein